MSLNLIKLCVGVETVEDLEAWISSRLEEKRRAGQPVEQFHTTRMQPKRAEELLDGGSLYWVIKAQVQCRQRLLDIRPVTDANGVSRCQLVLEPKLIRTDWQPRRAFQGWRYLEANEAPADADARGGSYAALPPALRGELAELGLL